MREDIVYRLRKRQEPPHANSAIPEPLGLLLEAAAREIEELRDELDKKERDIESLRYRSRLD